MRTVQIGSDPIGAAEFARLMAGLGPFERRPRIAVAVSGGADSMSLILLCHRWASARGGEAIALSVDHRLRPESAAEVNEVRRWLAAHAIPHHRLVWRHPGGRPASALQAEARSARYHLLTDWCRRQGVLHLALAHHAGDQAETVLMRLARGGGPDGLAGMSAIAERDGVRLIRPLLSVAPRRLLATLAAAGQRWIEDPSNRDPKFERVRWRRLISPELVPTLAAAASEIGEQRRRREGEVALLLAAARIDPAGFLEIPLAALRAAPAATMERALARCLIAIGGDPYPPSQASLARLADSLVNSGRSRTLGGCHVVRRDERLIICREAAAAAERRPAQTSHAIRWDRRFDLRPPGDGFIARLGQVGWDLLPPDKRGRPIPREAAASLPALWRRGQPVLPDFGHSQGRAIALFRPAQPLAASAFTVAKLNVNII